MSALNEINILREGAFVARVRQIMWDSAAAVLIAPDTVTPLTAGNKEEQVLKHNFIVAFVAAPDAIAEKVAQIAISELAPTTDDGSGFSDAAIKTAIVGALPLLIAAKRKVDGTLDIPAAGVAL